MKVPAVNFNNMTSSRYRAVSQQSGEKQDHASKKDKAVFADIPYVYPVTFGADEKAGGQAKLRKLFAYGLPCIYSGVIMIDPKQFTRWNDALLYSRPAVEVLNVLEPYNDSFQGKEARLLKLIKERSEIHPDKNIKELIEEVEPIFKRRLRKRQAPIFHELREAAQDLPDGYRYQFQELMNITDMKLNDGPVIIPFSSYEFKYILSKINDDIQNGKNAKAKKVMNKLMKESMRFSSKTNEKTIAHQQNVLKFLDVILKKSVLKDDKRLRELIDVSKSRLNQEKVVVPFSRKQFLYDLIKIIDDLPDKELKEKMLNIADQLPSSNESFSAYVVKIAADPADKIFHRILWGYLASVEHLLPKSEGGDRHNLANLGAARTILNSERKSRDFKLWIIDHPETAQNCQKYVDRLIELNRRGVFKKNGIDPKYIEDFKNTIYDLSGKKIDLDISEYNS